MKVVYLKYRDPMLFNRPNENVYPEDLEQIVPAIIRDAGIIIKEDEDTIHLGEAHVAEDNQTLHDWGLRHPYYRNVRVIAKSSIIERMDWTPKRARSPEAITEPESESESEVEEETSSKDEAILDQKISGLHEKGLDDAEIGKILEKSRPTISYHRKKLRLKAHGKDRLSTDEQLSELHVRGLTDQEMADQLGIHIITVRYHRKSLGLEINPQIPDNFSNRL